MMDRLLRWFQVFACALVPLFPLLLLQGGLATDCQAQTQSRAKSQPQPSAKPKKQASTQASTPAFAGSATTGRAGASAGFQSRERLLGWINHYRDDPQPHRVAGAIRDMARLGVFRDLDRAGVYIGFFAGVLAANQIKAPDIIAGVFPLAPEDQVVVIQAIADSGLPEWRDLLGRFAERMPARQILIRAYYDGSKSPLATLPLDDSPAVLDAWWGRYFASGGYEPILKMLPALAWTRETSSLERLTIGNMTQWTLAANASRDKALRDYLRAEIYRQPPRIAKPLERTVTAAETFTVNKLRKTAIARIAARKAKGPPKERGWAWWSQIAGTTIAVGCIVAGASGAGAAVGLPCLIGGTLSNAATNLLRAEERRRN